MSTTVCFLAKLVLGKADPVLFDYTGTGRNVPDFILHDIGELPAVLGIHAEVSLLV